MYDRTVRQGEREVGKKGKDGISGITFIKQGMPNLCPGMSVAVSQRLA